METRRTDCCGVMIEQIYVKADVDLAFCQHHANQHNVVLLAMGWERLKKPEETIDKNALVAVE